MMPLCAMPLASVLCTMGTLANLAHHTPYNLWLPSDIPLCSTAPLLYAIACMSSMEPCGVVCMWPDIHHARGEGGGVPFP